MPVNQMGAKYVFDCMAREQNCEVLNVFVCNTELGRIIDKIVVTI
jgi:hypothetical protein